MFITRTMRTNDGVALILAISIMSALLTVGLSIVLTVVGEVDLTREIDHSFRALYAADQGLERHFLLDRTAGSPYPPGVATNIPPINIPYPGGRSACYDAVVDKTNPLLTVITVNGRYDCGMGALLTVQRTLESSY